MKIERIVSIIVISVLIGVSLYALVTPQSRRGSLIGTIPPPVIHLRPRPSPSFTPLPDTPMADSTENAPQVINAASPYPMPLQYNARDIYNYILYNQMPIREDTAHHFYFQPNMPTSIVGFDDYSDASQMHWYIISVYTNKTQAQENYENLKYNTKNALATSDRCLLVSDTTVSATNFSQYMIIVQNGCRI